MTTLPFYRLRAPDVRALVPGISLPAARLPCRGVFSAGAFFKRCSLTGKHRAPTYHLSISSYCAVGSCCSLGSNTKVETYLSSGMLPACDAFLTPPC